tara:strand:+ start:647 stop:1831 length:1185 start_codon:yes stop_codon:yes gene_type:complete
MVVTRFLTRAKIIERMGDFTRHLRDHGVRAGMPETEASLKAIRLVDLSDVKDVRLALKAVCSIDCESFEKFDDLFDAYWLNSGKQRQEHKQTQTQNEKKSSFTNLSQMNQSTSAAGARSLDEPDNDNKGEVETSGEGKLVATEIVNKNATDMREFILPEDEAYAAETARRIAAAIRYRRSRRRKAAQRGSGLDMRRIMRKSVATGGEPLHLLRRRRPERPVHLVSILDVSGSMQLYARVFLSFIKGLIGNDQRTDAFLFHTSLICVSDALRDRDTLRAVNRLSMMSRGFGGGTKIGASLRTFNAQYSGRMAGRRTVVIIMSDGYDTGDASEVGNALAQLKRRGCKLIWLNPLLGWKDYQPVAASMAAALPHIDYFAPCNTINSLHDLEKELHHL